MRFLIVCLLSVAALLPFNKEEQKHLEQGRVQIKTADCLNDGKPFSGNPNQTNELPGQFEFTLDYLAVQLPRSY